MTPMARELTIGIDVGGTTVKGGIVDIDGSILATVTRESMASKGPDAVIRQICHTVKELLQHCKREEIIGVGVGAPGTVAADSGVVKYPPNFADWAEVELGGELVKALQLPITVENDANVAALAEARFGAGVGDPDFLFVIWGTGVGGGIILNGDIYRGPHGGAGEIGHTTIDYNGPICGCGNRGCIEAYIGQRYLSKRARERILPLVEAWKRQPAAAPPSQVIELLHGNLDGNLDMLNPQILSQAAGLGDTTAREILIEAGELLGVAIASVLNVLDLRMAIVGGGISAVEPFVFEAIERSVRGRVLKGSKEKICVRRAKLGNTAGILGAALLPGRPTSSRRAD